MPSTCCSVPGCHNRGGHSFPTDSKLRKAWICAIKRGGDRFTLWEPQQHTIVCKLHFKDDDYISETAYGSSPLHRRLKKGVIPNVFSWKDIASPQDCAREQRMINRGIKRKLLVEPDDTDITDDRDLHVPEVGLDVEISHDTNIMENEILSDMSAPTSSTSSTTCTQTPSYPMFSVDNFIDDDAGIHFYTALENYSRFQFVLRTLGPAAYSLEYVGHQVGNLSVENQFFMTLMKLRRHTTNFELSRLFGVSDNTVSNVVLTWINFLYLQWKELDLWPVRELVHHFTPSDFRLKFPTTRIIVDGTECPIKKPKAPKAQQATFSTYKNRNTVKTLVGATPGGYISYISPAYAGSTSDRQIVERSNLLTKCDPGDSIMADKGFTVQDIFAPSDICINIPSFFKKKNRLSGETVMKDRKIASKRVHIERIIGLAKTYKILTDTMTSTETKLATEIIFICFMLCNFRPCIVSSHA